MIAALQKHKNIIYTLFYGHMAHMVSPDLSCGPLGNIFTPTGYSIRSLGATQVHFLKCNSL